MKFTFKKDKVNGNSLYYSTNVVNSIQLGLNEEDLVFWGTYCTHFKGPHTAFASFNIQFRWEKDSHSWTGFKLNKFISSRNSGQVTRCWLNLMLNNSPSYILYNGGYGDGATYIEHT